MKQAAREALDAYYREAESWAEDRAGRVARVAPDRVDRRHGRGGRSRCVEAMALIVLTPLKTVEPYTLLVDRKTGYRPGARSRSTPHRSRPTPR